MPDLIQELVALRAETSPDQPALLFKDEIYSYAEFQRGIEAVARGLLGLGLEPGERVAVYLPKLPRGVMALFGAAAAGCVFVPVNPLLKPRQLAYILADCNVRVLITSGQRLAQLGDALTGCPDLAALVVVEDEAPGLPATELPVIPWAGFVAADTPQPPHRRIDGDMVAILYTSGSTGNPKGVVLSHRNMVAGAHSVASYLENCADDRVLAILPLSFDAGLSQLTTMFSVGGSVVLMDYLLPMDVLRAVQRYQVTGLAGVPPVWNQLARLEWPEAAVASLRYITSTGGAMPTATTAALRSSLPGTLVYLMYGLTEAFRSTYLPPDQVDKRPESIGKAIPNAEILVVNEQGRECAPNEPGELVHRGALVALGYWNAPDKTAERFRPCPGQPAQLTVPELAVWSGDQVRRDEEGYLYFVSRKDEMIKTSGYRVSPTEVEEVVHASGLVAEVAALGLPHPMLGQAILLAVTPAAGHEDGVEEGILGHCRRELPNYMVPQGVVVSECLPTNQNGKIDRKTLGAEFSAHFQET